MRLAQYLLKQLEHSGDLNALAMIWIGNPINAFNRDRIRSIKSVLHRLLFTPSMQMCCGCQ